MAQHDLVGSIDALQRCMAFLGLSPEKRTQSFSPRVIEANGKHTGGLANADFRIDPHTHDGPYLEFDASIRGYGITYEVFKPQFQSFAFEQKEDGERIGVLTVKNAKPSYSFSLEVSKERL